ncbi:MAG: class I SAM-dependent methyltransferase [Pseudomonadota bacterium]
MTQAPTDGRCADTLRWDKRFAGDDYFYGTEPNDFLRDHCSAIATHGRVLCLGEGEGRNAVFLAAQGHSILAVDLSATGLMKAERLAAKRAVSIQMQVANLADYPLGIGCWDAIVSIWCHLPRELRAKVHRRVVTALAPGGVFLLEAYTPAQLGHQSGGPTAIELLPTLIELRAELEGLEFVHAQECERIIHEGAGHEGLSAVVQIQAIRRD